MDSATRDECIKLSGQSSVSLRSQWSAVLNATLSDLILVCN